MKTYVMKIQQHTHSDAAKLILYQNKAYDDDMSNGRKDK